jgi:hypothetical protein
MFFQHIVLTNIMKYINKRIQSKSGNATLQSYSTCVHMQIAYSLVYEQNGDHSTGRQHEQLTCSRTSSLSKSVGVHSYPSTSLLFHLMLLLTYTSAHSMPLHVLD